MNSLEELVRAVQSGRRDAFAELVARYERTAIATAWTVLRDFHAAQDAAQEAFLIAYRQLPALRNARNFGSWLLAIVRREAIRLSKRAPQAADSLDAAQELTSQAETPWHVVHEELLKLIALLPEHEREVIVFHYLDGHSADAISEFTGRPIGTITKQLSRAIKRLQNSLRQVCNDGRT